MLSLWNTVWNIAWNLQWNLEWNGNGDGCRNPQKSVKFQLKINKAKKNRIQYHGHGFLKIFFLLDLIKEFYSCNQAKGAYNILRIPK